MQKEEDRAFDDCIDISLAHGSVHVTGVYSPRSSRHNTKTYGDRLAFNMMLIKSSNQPTELMLCNYKFNMFEGSPFDKLGYKPEHDENEEEHEEEYEEENEDEKDDYKPPKGRS